MERNAFLQRVRQAADRGRAHRVKQAGFPDEVGYVGSAADKCAALAGEINAVATPRSSPIRLASSRG